jgi:D-alanine-D-alanine ligase
MSNAHIDFPCVVKPHKSGSSLGIFICHNQEELHENIHKASLIEHKPQDVLVEEYIKGMEFTCIVITDYHNQKRIALEPTEIVPEEGSLFFDYTQKYMPGCATKFTPARCNQDTIQRIKDISIQAMEALEISNIARIDGFVTASGSLIISEANTLAGMSPSSFIFRQAAEMNMNHTEFINHLIQTELHAYNMLIDTNTSHNQNTQSATTKVAVLCGGHSHEKEISLESGRNVVYKLSPHKYEAIPIFVDDHFNLYKINSQLLVRNTTKEIQEGLTDDMRITWDDLKDIADFVFIALHGGHGENGHVQSMFEMLSLPYNGSSVFTSALCMDKYKTNEFLSSSGFTVPQDILISHAHYRQDKHKVVQQITNNLTLPCIVKPHDDGCSFFVDYVSNKKDLETALDTFFAHNVEYALVQEYIKGTELTVGVIGNNDPFVLEPSKVICSSSILSIEEKFLPGAGENQTPAPLERYTRDMIQQEVKRVYKALQCKGYARIDCFYQDKNESPTGKERVIILEVNTLPGLTPATCIFHQAAEHGIKPMDFIDIIVELGFQEHLVSGSHHKTDAHLEYIHNKEKDA